MSRAGVHFCETVEDGWRPCPPELCEAERLWAELEYLRALLSDVVTRCEDANTEWSRLDVAAIARRGDECAPFPRGGM